MRQGDVLMVIEIHDSGWWLGEVSYGGRTKSIQNGGEKQEQKESEVERSVIGYQSEKIVREVGYFPATYCAYLSSKECQPNDDANSWET